MRRWLCAILILTLFATLTPATAKMESPAALTDPTSQGISLINDARARNGLPPLSVSSELASSAQSYASAMGHKGFFGHVGPDGSTLDTRDAAAGYVDWTFLAENLAAGQPTAQQAVDAWIASPNHYTDMMSPLARDTGVGFVQVPGSKYVYYWVQEFGDQTSPVHTIDLPFVTAPARQSGFQP
jgi:uncharacterized protein YkwD